MDDRWLDSGVDPSVDGDDVTVLWEDGPSQYENAFFFLGCLLFAWLLLPLFAAGWRYLSTRSTRYVLTAETLTVAVGVLTRRVDTLETFRVKDLAVRKGLLQRLVRIGDVQLDTSDRSHPSLVLASIHNPDGVLRVLRRVTARARHQKGVREID